MKNNTYAVLSMYTYVSGSMLVHMWSIYVENHLQITITMLISFIMKRPLALEKGEQIIH